MEERPAPLSSPDCNLRGLEWMPLDVMTVLDSDLFTTSTGDEFKAAFALWCKSWRQVPAGSLPNDERALADLSRAKNWKKVREVAMRNWILCSDNRWYHPVLCDKAMEALPHRQEFENRKTAEAQRKERERADRKALFELLRKHNVVPDYNTKTSVLRELAKPFQSQPVTANGVTSDVTESVTGGVTGHGQVTARTGTRHDTTRHLLEEIPSAPAAPTPPSPSPEPAPSPAPKPARAPAPKPADEPPITADTWRAYSEAYELVYRTPPVRNAKVNSQLKQFVDRIGAEEAPFVAAFFLSHQNQLYVRACHPVDLLLKDAEGLRTQWKTGRTNAVRESGETPYQRSQRELVEKATGGLVSRRNPSLSQEHNDALPASLALGR